MTEPISTSDTAAPSPEQAQAQLDAILADRSHPYHLPGHRRSDAAAAEVLALRRASLGPDNRTLISYREEGDRAPVASGEPVPLSALYGREEFLSGIPGDVAPADRLRAADAVAACGLTFFEGQQLLNVTEGAVPDARDELDLAELWGDACDDNVRAVNRLLTTLRAVDADLHNKLLPFIQRRAPVANRVLAIARRLAR